MKEYFRKTLIENRKRGQAEIFGLIIIVIMLIFALLFFIKTRQEDTSTISMRSSFRANNLLNAIINVDIPNDGNMKDLLKVCLDTGECEDANGNLTEIFEKTLMSNEKYSFKGSVNGVGGISLQERGSCEEGIAASPFRLRGNYVFELKLCYS